MVRGRDLNRSPADQMKGERFEGRYITHFLNVLHLHGDFLPLPPELRNHSYAWAAEHNPWGSRETRRQRGEFLGASRDRQ